MTGLHILRLSVLSTGIMAFILSWNEYLLSSVLLSSDVMKTLTVGLANYISSTEIDWSTIMALGTATTIPIIILFFFDSEILRGRPARRRREGVAVVLLHKIPGSKNAAASWGHFAKRILNKI